jgi:protein-disulfide isomerase
VLHLAVLKTLSRRLGVVLAVALGMVLPAMVAAAPAASPFAVVPTDHILGNANAKVTVIEYGSVACPACAHFNETAFPQFKAKYIDTGKVRYVFRPMLTGVATVAMAGTRLAECAGNDKYFSVVDAVMRGQHEFYLTGENDVFAHAVLVRIAKSYNLDEAAFNTCVTNADGLRRINQGYADALAAGVRSTPTFIVNGKRIDGMEELEGAVTAALPK